MNRSAITKKIAAICALFTCLSCFAAIPNLNSTSYVSPIAKPSIAMFFSPNCPHCKKVEKFIAKHKLNNALTINQHDLTYKESGKLLATALQKCGSTEKVISLPIVVTDNDQCLTGENRVMNFFKEIWHAQTKK